MFRVGSIKRFVVRFHGWRIFLTRDVYFNVNVGRQFQAGSALNRVEAIAGFRQICFVFFFFSWVEKRHARLEKLIAGNPAV